MTSRAGWSTEWDRAVYVGYSSTVESINEKAGTQLGENCLLGIPPKNLADDNAPTPRKYTLFVNDGEPVQAVEWVEPTPALRVGASFLTPESNLSYSPPGVMAGD
ncbi:hypothetical protein [Nocardia asteroides]|uniref:hypothetical protein n=1 Tax=Nocardia asteroides TaxID=1824 RepID=UPI001E546600|nr:hypothetical protein [Nocardia asteroides]UGT57561.1 hypothetical protein LTT85_12280 [Nocardia asteroides]